MANTQLNAKLVACIVPTTNNAASQQFYNTLFGGTDFARSLNNTIQAHFRPISQDGLTLAIAPRHDTREPIVCLFAVANLSTMISQLVAVGGTVVINPTALPVSATATALNAQPATSSTSTVGQFAAMQDPDGNYFGLIQVDSSMQSWFTGNMTLTTAQANLQGQLITAGTAIS